MRTPVLCAALACLALTGCTTYGDGYYGHRDRYYGDRDWAPDHDWATDYHEGNYEPYALGPRDRIYRGADRQCGAKNLLRTWPCRWRCSGAGVRLLLHLKRRPQPASASVRTVGRCSAAGAVQEESIVWATDFS